MKTNDDMNNGGNLKPEYRAVWAECMAKYAAHYRAAGCDVRRISVQNEPAAVQTWDSCIYSGKEESEFAAQFLAPALEAEGCGDVKILVWNHNKEIPVYRATIRCPRRVRISSLADSQCIGIPEIILTLCAPFMLYIRTRSFGLPRAVWNTAALTV